MGWVVSCGVIAAVENGECATGLPDHFLFRQGAKGKLVNDKRDGVSFQPGTELLAFTAFTECRKVDQGSVDSSFAGSTRITRGGSGFREPGRLAGP